jgi:Phage integrase, N-terminal SAM-like domain
MARASDPIARFARFLAQPEHSPLTIKNYRSDLDAFAAWFQSANSEPMEPARITPTDLRQFKRWLVEQRRLNPNTVNRCLMSPMFRRRALKPITAAWLHQICESRLPLFSAVFRLPSSLKGWARD